MVTGGIAPTALGRLTMWSSKLSNRFELKAHKVVPQAVHEHGGKICLQILHSGRYAYHSWPVAPSPLKSPISRFPPLELSTRHVNDTVEAFVRTAVLAREAGYDGVEIMGSEGYLIHEFICAKLNKRSVNLILMGKSVTRDALTVKTTSSNIILLCTYTNTQNR
jgi:2,4-dienoyl-CoA reductase (NADPH2)